MSMKQKKNYALRVIVLSIFYCVLHFRNNPIKLTLFWEWLLHRCLSYAHALEEAGVKGVVVSNLARMTWSSLLHVFDLWASEYTFDSTHVCWNLWLKNQSASFQIGLKVCTRIYSLQVAGGVHEDVHIYKADQRGRGNHHPMHVPLAGQQSLHCQPWRSSRVAASSPLTAAMQPCSLP